MPTTDSSSAAPPAAVAPAPIDSRALAQFLGAVGSADMAAPGMITDGNPATRLQLLGVVAAGATTGAALILIDQHDAQAFPVGSEVEAGLILQSVNGREAVLSRQSGAATLITLRMPPLEAPLEE